MLILVFAATLTFHGLASAQPAAAIPPPFSMTAMAIRVANTGKAVGTERARRVDHFKACFGTGELDQAGTVFELNVFAADQSLYGSSTFEITQDASAAMTHCIYHECKSEVLPGTYRLEISRSGSVLGAREVTLE